MITLRPAAERGRTRLDWLDSRHTFSFGGYDDPDHMGFGPLRVINDDRVKPGAGFATHSHRDMEILSYVLEGGLEHRDSLGTGSVIRPGDLQRMSAGTGVTHSEFNASKTDPVRFLQIWIIPSRSGIPPEYEQRHFAGSARQAKLCLMASPDGRDGSLTIHQDALVYASRLDSGQRVAYAPRPGRLLWLQVAVGGVSLNGRPLAEGDGAALGDEARAEISGASKTASEVLLFDLA